MLRWSFLFLVLAIVAAVLGFGKLAESAAGIAQFLFFLFIAVWLIMLIAGAFFVKKH
jgi:uncharacterized membrane protein YtjA (UPF0391 family)